MNDPLVYQAWVEIGKALPGIVQITEVSLDWDLALNPATGCPFGAWEFNELQIGARRAV